MIKKKQHQPYSWISKTDDALKRYFKWESKPHIQNRIYKEHIEIPLRNIILSMIIKEQSKGNWEKLIEYGLQNYNIEDDYGNKVNPIIKERNNLVDECVSFFFTTLCPYIKNGTIKNNFAYLYKSIHHYLTNKNIENSDTLNYTEPLPSFDSENEKFFRDNSEFVKIPDSNLSDDETEFINLMMNYWEYNIDFIWRGDLQREIARNVIELFRRSHTIKYFRTTSMRRYLRKMMEWKSNEGIYNKKGSGGNRNAFNNVIRKMRDRNRLMRQQYLLRGTIDFSLPR